MVARYGAMETSHLTPLNTSLLTPSPLPPPPSSTMPLLHLLLVAVAVAQETGLPTRLLDQFSTGAPGSGPNYHSKYTVGKRTF